MYAKVILELFKSGVHIYCEDADFDDFIPLGEGNKFMDALNEIYACVDPDTVYKLTEKGEEYLKQLEDENMV